VALLSCTHARKKIMFCIANKVSILLRLFYPNKCTHYTIRHFAYKCPLHVQQLSMTIHIEPPQSLSYIAIDPPTTGRQLRADYYRLENKPSVPIRCLYIGNVFFITIKKTA